MSTDHDLLSRAHAPSARTAADPATDPVTPPGTTVPYQRPRLDQIRAALSERFRLPTEDDTPPSNARMLGLCFWAAACAFIGLVPAGRLALGLLFGGLPLWYPATAIAIGMLGVGLIAGGFAAIHRAHLPWYLLGAATILLGANVALLYTTV